jgi:hypothetical protein
VVAGVDFGLLDLPPGDPYDEFMELVDDTGTIQVDVPTAWSETDTAPRGPDEPAESDEAWPSAGASTDIDDFYDAGFGAPGVVVVNNLSAESEQGELDALDTRIDLSGNCDDGAAFDYDDGSHSGLAQLWTGCGPGGAAELAISTFAGEDHLVAILTLLSEPTSTPPPGSSRPSRSPAGRNPPGPC